MKFEAKTYKRIGAMVGSIIGVLAMVAAVCMEKVIIGAGLLIICVGIGMIVGNMIEKTHGDR